MNFRQMIFGAALCAAMAVSADAVAQEQKRAGGESGGISAEMLGLIRSGYKGNACDKAIKNALAGTSIGVLAVNSENAAMMDTHFFRQGQDKRNHRPEVFRKMLAFHRT